MAQPKSPAACIQVVAIFSRFEAALGAARDQITTGWGNIELASELFDHSVTSYYQAEMGQGLKKQLLVVSRLYDPTKLVGDKLQSNAWEGEIAAAEYDAPRPVNIDAGYLTLTKFVLASAKDRAHRIYLGDGIYAEECLHFLAGTWRHRPWTYPDYAREDFQEFLITARDYLKKLVK